MLRRSVRSILFSEKSHVDSVAAAVRPCLCRDVCRTGDEWRSSLTMMSSYLSAQSKRNEFIACCRAPFSDASSGKSFCSLLLSSLFLCKSANPMKKNGTSLQMTHSINAKVAFVKMTFFASSATTKISKYRLRKFPHYQKMVPVVNARSMEER